MYDHDLDLDLLDIGSNAHVEVESVDAQGEPASDGSERTLNVASIAGDGLGTLHVGQTDVVDIMLTARTIIPFNVIVYQVIYIFYLLKRT